MKLPNYLSKKKMNTKNSYLILRNKTLKRYKNKKIQIKVQNRLFQTFKTNQKFQNKHHNLLLQLLNQILKKLRSKSKGNLSKVSKQNLRSQLQLKKLSYKRKKKKKSYKLKNKLFRMNQINLKLNYSKPTKHQISRQTI